MEARWTAERYERVRPGYPPEVAEDLLTAATPDDVPVLDVAAGTGKFTRSLARATSGPVVAVEPLTEMGRVLRAVVPAVPVVAAVAESLPVRSSCVGLVTVAQAWHWIDGPRALDEFARVLGSGGVAAVIWNTGDHDVDWVRAIDDLRDRLASRDPTTARVTREAFRERRWVQPLETHSAFGPLEQRRLPNPVRMRTGSLIELVASSSLVEALDETDREAFLRDVRGVLDAHPQTSRPGEVVYPYRTEVVWTRRR